MSIRPLHDRVVVKRLESEKTTPGGIVIPDNAKEKPITAEVIALGNGKLFANGDKHAMTVKVGNKVLIGKYSGTDVKVGGAELVVLREYDILGVLES
ncbi:co-chaperone GroES [Methylotuvimicrobium sp. KM1]|uniref:co-chaperone GroES n=1 Tax=Methylotuvimicrobium sp. KM1 TaxID=3377707 RepID=UPI00384BB1E7